MMFAFTPNSMLDWTSLNIKSRFSLQMIDETHINLHRAKMADLSKMQR